MSEAFTEIIQQCIRGDRASQNRLYEIFAPKMFVVCLRYCRNREEAEEIMQEGFIKVFKHLGQFKFAGSFEGWIKRIMVNCALEKYRSKSPLQAIVNIDHLKIEQAHNENVSADLGTKELLKLVQKLPPAYRMVFNLFVFEGMKHREIATHLGISEGTSKSNLSDARALLQKALAAQPNVGKQKVSYL